MAQWCGSARCPHCTALYCTVLYCTVLYCAGDHVSYAPECDGESNECHDLACPASHPVTLPEIHLYVR